MKSNIQTLTQALTTLTNKMADGSSSGRGRGGNIGGDGYATDNDNIDSDNENVQKPTQEAEDDQPNESGRMKN